jgi:mannonate dehydratase
MALWDIAGKRAAARVYRHAAGSTVEETLDQARAFMADGFGYIRLQVGQPGVGTYGAPGSRDAYPGHPHPDGWDVRHYLRTTPALFERARAELGDEVELLHDVHSRLTPKEAVVLARSLEPYRLYFLEDPIAPEFYDRLPEVRAASPMPLAVGELVSTVGDAVRLVRDLGVDLIRLHISAIGGLTPARKIAHLSELLGVRTAWHAPGDVSPVGAAANIALDVSSQAFGIQEAYVYSDRAHEVFPGTPIAVNGYVTPSDRPGWGVDLDEKQAAQYPPEKFLFDRWATSVRNPDGSLNPP